MNHYLLLFMSLFTLLWVLRVFEILGDIANIIIYLKIIDRVLKSLQKLIIKKKRLQKE